MELIECTKVNIENIKETPILSENIRKELGDMGDTYLTVYTKKSRTLRFFPTKDENIFWIKISINSFEPETSGRILAKLNKLVSEFIYSTGVCISKSECFWDGLVLESALKTSRDNVITSLEEIPNVSKVIINTID